jgi:hypothetical protein
VLFAEFYHNFTSNFSFVVNISTGKSKLQTRKSLGNEEVIVMGSGQF